uniref:Uncharacterized protein n=1 Tax=Chromera velia CCMP2878 TaxID=1169474 RepID=A0A0G4EZX1_9ALVE|eukprot:Cvel_14393.t1-p1 / transcript=Cvel_14393.t1 / gene=Cvel_14393 / organism=Chromera_velia_CCMP2878 / gene_product=hypothetical protein / transcript_product=hypothetical protein / location=Cvel_scaffold1021:39173-59363(-) / protein_length=3806 / sequence_SO=supercontig / SO=protein_coding / is_pseudo=false
MHRGFTRNVIGQNAGASRTKVVFSNVQQEADRLYWGDGVLTPVVLAWNIERTLAFTVPVNSLDVATLVVFDWFKSFAYRLYVLSPDRAHNLQALELATHHGLFDVTEDTLFALIEVAYSANSKEAPGSQQKKQTAPAPGDIPLLPQSRPLHALPTVTLTVLAGHSSLCAAFWTVLARLCRFSIESADELGRLFLLPSVSSSESSSVPSTAADSRRASGSVPAEGEKEEEGDGQVVQEAVKGEGGQEGAEGHASGWRGSAGEGEGGGGSDSPSVPLSADIHGRPFAPPTRIDYYFPADTFSRHEKPDYGNFEGLWDEDEEEEEEGKERRGGERNSAKTAEQSGQSVDVSGREVGEVEGQGCMSFCSSASSSSSSSPAFSSEIFGGFVSHPLETDSFWEELPCGAQRRQIFQSLCVHLPPASLAVIADQVGETIEHSHHHDLPLTLESFFTCNAAGIGSDARLSGSLNFNSEDREGGGTTGMEGGRGTFFVRVNQSFLSSVGRDSVDPSAGTHFPFPGGGPEAGGADPHRSSMPTVWPLPDHDLASESHLSSRPATPLLGHDLPVNFAATFATLLSLHATRRNVLADSTSIVLQESEDQEEDIEEGRERGVDKTDLDEEEKEEKGVDGLKIDSSVSPASGILPSIEENGPGKRRRTGKKDIEVLMEREVLQAARHLVKAAASLIGKGEFESAFPLISTYCVWSPSDPQGHILRAWVLKGLQRYRGALRAINLFFFLSHGQSKNNPDEEVKEAPSVLRLMGSIYEKKAEGRRGKKPKKKTGEGNTYMGWNPSDRVLAFDLLGTCYFEMFEQEEFHSTERIRGGGGGGKGRLSPGGGRGGEPDGWVGGEGGGSLETILYLLGSSEEAFTLGLRESPGDTHCKEGLRRVLSERARFVTPSQEAVSPVLPAKGDSGKRRQKKGPPSFDQKTSRTAGINNYMKKKNDDVDKAKDPAGDAADAGGGGRKKKGTAGRDEDQAGAGGSNGPRLTARQRQLRQRAKWQTRREKITATREKHEMMMAEMAGTPVRVLFVDTRQPFDFLETASLDPRRFSHFFPFINFSADRQTGTGGGGGNANPISRRLLDEVDSHGGGVSAEFVDERKAYLGLDFLAERRAAASAPDEVLTVGQPEEAKGDSRRKRRVSSLQDMAAESQMTRLRHVWLSWLSCCLEGNPSQTAEWSTLVFEACWRVPPPPKQTTNRFSVSSSTDLKITRPSLRETQDMTEKRQSFSTSLHTQGHQMSKWSSSEGEETRMSIRFSSPTLLPRALRVGGPVYAVRVDRALPEVLVLFRARFAAPVECALLSALRPQDVLPDEYWPAGWKAERILFVVEKTGVEKCHLTSSLEDRTSDGRFPGGSAGKKDGKAGTVEKRTSEEERSGGSRGSSDPQVSEGSRPSSGPEGAGGEEGGTPDDCPFTDQGAQEGVPEGQTAEEKAFDRKSMQQKQKTETQESSEEVVLLTQRQVWCSLGFLLPPPLAQLTFDSDTDSTEGDRARAYLRKYFQTPEEMVASSQVKVTIVDRVAAKAHELYGGVLNGLMRTNAFGHESSVEKEKAEKRPAPPVPKTTHRLSSQEEMHNPGQEREGDAGKTKGKAQNETHVPMGALTRVRQILADSCPDSSFIDALTAAVDPQRESSQQRSTDSGSTRNGEPMLREAGSILAEHLCPNPVLWDPERRLTDASALSDPFSLFSVPLMRHWCPFLPHLLRGQDPNTGKEYVNTALPTTGPLERADGRVEKNKSGDRVRDSKRPWEAAAASRTLDLRRPGEVEWIPFFPSGPVDAIAKVPFIGKSLLAEFGKRRPLIGEIGSETPGAFKECVGTQLSLCFNTESLRLKLGALGLYMFGVVCQQIVKYMESSLMLFEFFPSASELRHYWTKAQRTAGGEAVYADASEGFDRVAEHEKALAHTEMGAGAPIEDVLRQIREIRLEQWSEWKMNSLRSWLMANAQREDRKAREGTDPLALPPSHFFLGDGLRDGEGGKGDLWLAQLLEDIFIDASISISVGSPFASLRTASRENQRFDAVLVASPLIGGAAVGRESDGSELSSVGGLLPLFAYLEPLLKEKAPHAYVQTRESEELFLRETRHHPMAPCPLGPGPLGGGFLKAQQKKKDERPETADRPTKKSEALVVFRSPRLDGQSSQQEKERETSPSASLPVSSNALVVKEVEAMKRFHSADEVEELMEKARKAKKKGVIRFSDGAPRGRQAAERRATVEAARVSANLRTLAAAASSGPLPSSWKFETVTQAVMPRTVAEGLYAVDPDLLALPLNKMHEANVDGLKYRNRPIHKDTARRLRLDQSGPFPPPTEGPPLLPVPRKAQTPPHRRLKTNRPLLMLTDKESSPTEQNEVGSSTFLTELKDETQPVSTSPPPPSQPKQKPVSSLILSTAPLSEHPLRPSFFSTEPASTIRLRLTKNEQPSLPSSESPDKIPSKPSSPPSVPPNTSRRPAFIPTLPVTEQESIPPQKTLSCRLFPPGGSVEEAVSVRKRDRDFAISGQTLAAAVAASKVPPTNRPFLDENISVSPQKKKGLGDDMKPASMNSIKPFQGMTARETLIEKEKERAREKKMPMRPRFVHYSTFSRAGAAAIRSQFGEKWRIGQVAHLTGFFASAEPTAHNAFRRHAAPMASSFASEFLRVPAARGAASGFGGMDDIDPSDDFAKLLSLSPWDSAVCLLGGLLPGGEERLIGDAFALLSSQPAFPVAAGGDFGVWPFQMVALPESLRRANARLFPKQPKKKRADETAEEAAKRKAKKRRAKALAAKKDRRGLHPRMREIQGITAEDLSPATEPSSSGEIIDARTEEGRRRRREQRMAERVWAGADNQSEGESSDESVAGRNEQDRQLVQALSMRASQAGDKGRRLDDHGGELDLTTPWLGSENRDFLVAMAKNLTEVVRLAETLKRTTQDRMDKREKKKERQRRRHLLKESIKAFATAISLQKRDDSPRRGGVMLSPKSKASEEERRKQQNEMSEEESDGNQTSDGSAENDVVRGVGLVDGESEGSDDNGRDQCRCAADDATVRMLDAWPAGSWYGPRLIRLRRTRTIPARLRVCGNAPHCKQPFIWGDLEKVSCKLCMMATYCTKECMAAHKAQHASECFNLRNIRRGFESLARKPDSVVREELVEVMETVVRKQWTAPVPRLAPSAVLSDSLDASAAAVQEKSKKTNLSRRDKALQKAPTAAHKHAVTVLPPVDPPPVRFLTHGCSSLALLRLLVRVGTHLGDGAAPRSRTAWLENVLSSNEHVLRTAARGLLVHIMAGPDLSLYVDEKTKKARIDEKASSSQTQLQLQRGQSGASVSSPRRSTFTRSSGKFLKGGAGRMSTLLKASSVTQASQVSLTQREKFTADQYKFIEPKNPFFVLSAYRAALHMEATHFLSALRPLIVLGVGAVPRQWQFAVKKFSALAGGSASGYTADFPPNEESFFSPFEMNDPVLQAVGALPVKMLALPPPPPPMSSPGCSPSVRGPENGEGEGDEGIGNEGATKRVGFSGRRQSRLGTGGGISRTAQSSQQIVSSLTFRERQAQMQASVHGGLICLLPARHRRYFAPLHSRPNSSLVCVAGVVLWDPDKSPKLARMLLDLPTSASRFSQRHAKASIRLLTQPTAPPVKEEADSQPPRPGDQEAPDQTQKGSSFRRRNTSLRSRTDTVSLSRTITLEAPGSLTQRPAKQGGRVLSAWKEAANRVKAQNAAAVQLPVPEEMDLLSLLARLNEGGTSDFQVLDSLTIDWTQQIVRVLLYESEVQKGKLQIFLLNLSGHSLEVCIGLHNAWPRGRQVFFAGAQSAYVCSMWRLNMTRLEYTGFQIPVTLWLRGPEMGCQATAGSVV